MVGNLVKTAAAASALACLAACGTQTYWQNPRVSAGLQQQQFNLDSAECTAMANQVIPEPAQAPPPQSGQIVLNTPNGPVRGTYTSQSQPSASPISDGYQRGVRQGQRNQYAVACMGARGWQQQSVR